MVVRKPRPMPPPGPYYYAQMRQPFTMLELQTFLTHLGQAELVIAVIFLVQGSTCPGSGSWVQSEYLNFCGTATLCGLCSLLGSFVGLVTLKRRKRKIYVVAHLILSFAHFGSGFCGMGLLGLKPSPDDYIRTVSSLLLVITASIWANVLGKTSGVRMYTLLPFWIFLLLGVCQGVCFILSSVFICQSWENRRQIYSLHSIQQVFEPITGGITHLQSPANNAFVDAPV